MTRLLKNNTYTFRAGDFIGYSILEKKYSNAVLLKFKSFKDIKFFTDKNCEFEIIEAVSGWLKSNGDQWINIVWQVDNNKNLLHFDEVYLMV